MKLQIAFDTDDLDRALAVAEKIEPYADIFEIGTLLIYKHGATAVEKFRDAFPGKTLLADAKIIDRSKDAVTIFAHAGADWISVMAGASSTNIHTAAAIAHSFGKKIMLDLSDASSIGQSALEAKSLGADAVVFHKTSAEEQSLIFLERWDMVKGNTTLPIFVSAHITRDTIAEVLNLAADGIVLGSSVFQAQDPEKEIAYFSQLAGK
jgi:3-keto-L-gulonate-6-phosphate decarboxylase